MPFDMSCQSRQWLKLLLSIFLALGGLALLLSGGISLAQPLFSLPLPLGLVPDQGGQGGAGLLAISGISGTVTSFDGAPLSEVKVTVYREQPSGWEQMRSTSTDATGRYAIVALETATYRMRFWDQTGVYAFEYYSDVLTLDAAAPSIPAAAPTGIASRTPLPTWGSWSIQSWV